MNKMRISIASCLISLLILQCNANDIVPTTYCSTSIEECADKYSSNLMRLLDTSEESADNVLKAIQDQNRNIPIDFRDFLEIQSELFPKDLLKSLETIKSYLLTTSENFFEGLSRFKNVLHGGKIDSSEEKEIVQSNIKFAQKVIAEFNVNGLGKIREIINPDFLSKAMPSNDLCVTRETHKHLLEVLLTNVHYATIINYALMNILRGFLKKSDDNSGNLTSVEDIQSKIVNGYNSVKLIKAQIGKVFGEFYACGPKEVDPTSFIQLKAFQKYLFVEDQIRPGYYCNNNCSAVNDIVDPLVCFVENYEFYDNNNICLKTKKCKKLHCSKEQDEKDFSQFDVCVNGSLTDDRYLHYKKRNSSHFKQCPGSLLSLSPSHGARGKLFTDHNDDHCKVCDCTCLDNEYYVSLEPALVDENMVLVGARFKLLNNTLHIQLRQGKLLPNGHIDNSTVTWKSFNSNNSLNRAKIDWRDLRAIDLTKNTVSQGRVLTGLKFVKISDEDEKDSAKKNHIALAVHSKRYDFVQGQLNGDSQWQLPPVISKKELPLLGDDIPRKSSAYRHVSENYEYVMLTTSGSFEDGGQSTIPFIDNRDVIQQTSTPLSGANLAYLSYHGSGGFLGLKLTIYDESKLL